MEHQELSDQLDAAVAAANRPRWLRFLRHPVRSVLPRLLGATNKVRKLRAPTFFGTDMTVVLPEVVSTLVYRHHCYEADLSHAMIYFLKPGDTFFDVGAHFGYASLLASRLVGTTGKIVAFEPTPRTRAILQENLAPISSARVEPLAVWDKEADIELQDFGLQRSAWNSFTKPRAPDSRAHDFVESVKFSVRTTSIDAYVARTGLVPSFMKIDVESAEMDVLRGADETLRKGNTIVSLEVGDYDISGIASSRALVEYLNGLGFRAYEMREGKPESHRPKERYDYQNIVFVPASRPVAA